jgi:hypothetical protein
VVLLHISYASTQSASRLFRRLILAEIFLVAAYWIDILLGEPVHLLHGLFDLDGEANIPTWFSSGQLLAIAIALWAVAFYRHKPARPSRAFLLTLGTVFLLLSADEVVQLHEGITGLLGSRYLDWVPTMLGAHRIALLLLLGISLVAFRIVYPDLKAAWRWSRKGCVVAIVGCCVVVLGGCVLESIAYRFLQPGSLAYKLEVSVEEFLEMLGATLILHSVTTFALDSLDLLPASGLHGRLQSLIVAPANVSQAKWN